MTGGRGQTYNAKSLRVVRFSTVVLTIVLALYEVLIYFEFVEEATIYNRWLALGVLGLFALLSLLMNMIRPRTKLALGWFLACYYLVTTLTSVFVTGNTPTTFIFWLMVFIATDGILGLRSLLYMVSFYLATLVLLCGVLPYISYLDAIEIVTAGVLTVGTALFVAWLRLTNIIQYSLYQQAKKRERAHRERLSTVINSISEAIIGLSPSGQITIFNAAALNLLDTNMNLDGQHIDKVLNLVDGNDQPVSLEQMTHKLGRGIERDDLVWRTPDHQQRRLYVSCEPVRAPYGADKMPDAGGTIVILRDITRAKSLEEERDEFISVVSHELRTPVAIAEGTLSNLQFMLEKGGGDPKILLPSLGEAHEQIMYLGGMVNDLSTLSRAERGVGMEPEIINVREFMEELYKNYQEQARKRHLKLDLAMSVGVGQINVSRMAFHEIMQNFVDNALKYTRKGSITLLAERQKSGQIQFGVRDTGIGISKADQSNVYRKFWRSEDYRTRETNGTGLGLHVTEQLADMIGAPIKLTSRLNHGSTFSIELPEYKPQTEATPDSPAP
jgi:signal transduction histidine kinase